MKHPQLAEHCWNLLTYENPDTIVEALERLQDEFKTGLVGPLAAHQKYYDSALSLSKDGNYVDARLMLQDLLKLLRH